jgi:hypothetical protein
MRRTAPALAVALLVTRSAAADTDQNKATAEALFTSAQALALQKNYAEACPKFAESVRLDPGLGAMLWLADCYENNGQTASAWAEFRQAASVAAQRQDPREAVAKRRAAALEPKLNKVTVFLPQGESVPGLEVRRDGVILANAEIGIPVPVNPGIHAFAANAPGRKPWSANIDVPSSRRDPVVINIPSLEAGDTPATPPPPSPPPAAEPPPAQPAPVVEDTSWSTTRIVGVSAGAVGVVGIGIGAILGLSAKAALDASNEGGHCLGNSCDPTGTDKRNSALDLATGSTIAFVAGGVLLAGGAALFLLGPAHRTTGALRVLLDGRF